MGFSAKAKSSSSSENWGMGLLLVFFPDDETILNNNEKKKNPFSSPSPSSSSFRRTNSNNLILSKAQSTISICALLVFITLLLFTLSTFEPTIPKSPSSHFSTSTTTTPRRYLSEKNFTNRTKNTHHINSSWFTKFFTQKKHGKPKSQTMANSYALQGMGTLFLRGTRAMNNLIVIHVMDDEIEDQFRLFLRVLHRSGLTSKSDVVFIFPSSSLFYNSSVLTTIIREENDSFLKLVRLYSDSGVTQFLKKEEREKERERGEPIWGRKIRGGNYSINSDNESELSYGSVVGFDSDELDTENSLSGFFDHHLPMSLRRWACYPMLLGRVRRNYKHMMLVEMKNLLILSDPLGRVRTQSPESVYLYHTNSVTKSSKHNRKNSDKTRSINSAIIMGGSRGVRRLSNAMLTEIVRVAMQRKSKNSVTESGILSQLVRNEFISKNINWVVSTESIPDVSSLGGLNSNSGSSSSSSLSLSGYAVVRRGNSNYRDINYIIMKEICSSLSLDSSVYRECVDEEEKQRK